MPMVRKLFALLIVDNLDWSPFLLKAKTVLSTCRRWSEVRRFVADLRIHQAHGYLLPNQEGARS
jgi:hypothetical protein